MKQPSTSNTAPLGPVRRRSVGLSFGRGLIFENDERQIRLESAPESSLNVTLQPLKGSVTVQGRVVSSMHFAGALME